MSAARTLLRPVQGPPETVRMEVTAPLRHLCPFKNEIDDGAVTVRWSTCGNTLELHALSRYLRTFAGTKISHEDLTERIKHEIDAVPGIFATSIETHWQTAGMEVTCSTWQTPAAPK